MKRVSLNSLRIVTPCPVAWSSMKGDDAVRFCGKCSKNVYNVAALSEAEAIAVIERAEGRVCLQLTRRPDGTVVTGDCWAQLRRARKRGMFALAIAAPAILLAALWSQAFGLRALSGLFRHEPVPQAAPVTHPPLPHPRDDGDDHIIIKGKIAFAPPAPVHRTLGRHRAVHVTRGAPPPRLPPENLGLMGLAD